MTNERTCQLCNKPINMETQRIGNLPDPVTNLVMLAHLDCITQMDQFIRDKIVQSDTNTNKQVSGFDEQVSKGKVIHKSGGVYHPTSTLATCDICHTPLLPGQETLTVNRRIGPITVHQACYADDLNAYPNTRGVPGISREAAQKLGYRGAE